MPQGAPLLVSLLFALTLNLLSPTGGLAQVGTKDPKGVAVLTQSVNASGATNPLKPVQDFTATGTITYFWAGEQVQGTATVRGRAPDQFRLDANLPSSPACVGCAGTRSYAVNRWAGALKEADSAVKEIPLHNVMNVGVLTFPYLNVQAALNDPLTEVKYVGLAEVAGHQAHQVRVVRHFPPETDPDGTIAKLCTTDYFGEPVTYLVLKTLDMTHPNETLIEDLLHEVEFENYAPADGVMVPMLIREKIIGQTIWELRLTGVVFNAGLMDATFALQ